MQLSIHGRTVDYRGQECGIYRQKGMEYAYAVMDLRTLATTLDRLPRDTVVDQLSQLRDLAATQMQWTQLPTFGAPVLVQVPAPEPISAETKGYLENTKRLAEDMLRVLKGE